MFLLRNNILIICLISLLFNSFYGYSKAKDSIKLTTNKIKLINRNIDIFVHKLHKVGKLGRSKSDVLFVIKIDSDFKNRRNVDFTLSYVDWKSTLECCLPQFNYFYEYEGMIWLVLNVKNIETDNTNIKNVNYGGTDMRKVYSRVFDDLIRSKSIHDHIDLPAIDDSPASLTYSQSFFGFSKRNFYWELWQVPRSKSTRTIIR